MIIELNNTCDEFTETLYINAFPPDERRPVEEWKKLHLSTKPFTIYTIIADKKQSGIITIWQFKNFTYIEHFAILPHLRNFGIGTAVINKIKTLYNNIIIEVEPPQQSILATKRHNFYIKNQFTDFNQKYTQPPYTNSSAQLDMIIMHYGKASFKQTVKTLYKFVYNIK